MVLSLADSQFPLYIIIKMGGGGVGRGQGGVFWNHQCFLYLEIRLANARFP